MSVVRLLSAAVLVAAAVARAAEPQIPIPDTAAQKKAEIVIKDLFKAEYAKTKSPDRRDLAAKLLRTAGAEKNVVTRFVLLREARDLAAQNSSFELAQESNHALASAYEVEEKKDLAEVIRVAFKVTNLAKVDLLVLAAGEVAKPSEIKPAAELAEAWANYSSQETGRTRALMLGRAAYWYAVAVDDPNATGLSKKEIENKKSRLITTIEAADEKSGRWTLWEGKWEVKYDNGAVRVYTISPAGQLESSDRQPVRLVRNKDGVHCRVPDGEMEVFHHPGKGFAVDHFNPAQNYPQRIKHKGIGARVP